MDLAFMDAKPHEQPHRRLPRHNLNLCENQKLTKKGSGWHGIRLQALELLQMRPEQDSGCVWGSGGL